jgi:hypothetical protein
MDEKQIHHLREITFLSNQVEECNLKVYGGAGHDVEVFLYCILFAAVLPTPRLHYHQHYLINNSIPSSSYLPKQLIPSFSETLVVIKNMGAGQVLTDASVVGDDAVAVFIENRALLDLGFLLVIEP